MSVRVRVWNLKCGIYINNILIQTFILFGQTFIFIDPEKGLAHRRSLWKSSPNSKLLSRNFRHLSAPAHSCIDLWSTSGHHLWTCPHTSASGSLKTHLRQQKHTIRHTDSWVTGHWLIWWITLFALKGKINTHHKHKLKLIVQLVFKTEGIVGEGVIPTPLLQKESQKTTFNFKYVLT